MNLIFGCKIKGKNKLKAYFARNWDTYNCKFIIFAINFKIAMHEEIALSLHSVDKVDS